MKDPRLKKIVEKRKGEEWDSILKSGDDNERIYQNIMAKSRNYQEKSNNFRNFCFVKKQN